MTYISPAEAELRVLRSILVNIVIPAQVVDPRIDADAQKSIIRLSKGDLRQRLYALGLISKVQAGLLGGIHSDASEPAQRLASLRSQEPANLLQDQDAAFIRSGDGKPSSLLIFRETARARPQTLDQALCRAVDDHLKTLSAEEIENSKPAIDVHIPAWCHAICVDCALSALSPLGIAVACSACVACTADVGETTI